MNIEQLTITVKKAEKIIRMIREKYPSLSGYLVYSSQSGQCDMTANIKDILKSFPDMIQPSLHKERCLEIIGTMRAINELPKVLNALELKNDTFIEMRFTKVNLDWLFGLQKDNIISQIHSPQTKSSIRIVLGTLEEVFKRNLTY